MQLSAFKVENYRSVLNSGWVELTDTAVIVGKNESGKTSLLKALWKLKPFRAEPYSLDREWPRGRRKDRSEKAIVVTARFSLSVEEKLSLSAVDPSCMGIETVEISKSYDGKYHVTYAPRPVPNKRNGHSAAALLQLELESALKGKSATDEHFRTALKQAGATLADCPFDRLATSLAEVKGSLVATATDLEDSALAAAATAACDAVVGKMKDSPYELACTRIFKWMPTFIYMDDFLAFKGTAFLDQVKQRKDASQLKDDDRTIITIMEMAGLDLDEEVAKGSTPDREQRMLDLNDASQTLTNEIASRWSQKKYEVQFQADGHHFITFVKDEETKALVPLEERSKGFQWFFSFDMKFMYETEGEFENSVILLDEPGLHLHAAAQRDLLKRMKAYSQKNQLIYSTHLPFMIDMDRLDNIWVAQERPGSGTVVHNNWATADKDARFTLQAALGLSWAQSLFVGRHNLVVEGVTDFWFLVTLSTLLKESGQDGLIESIVVTPAGGASKVAYIATLLTGQELRVAALLDSDDEGLAARKQLVNNWLLQDSDILLIGDIVGKGGTCSLEDLFEEKYYLSQVADAYAKELSGVLINLPASPKESIVRRLEVYFESMGVSFNKGRVAKRIMKEMATKTISEVSPDTVTRFRNAIHAVNAIARKWAP